ncbi:MAG TPA: hypothetical protein VKR32_19375 [Puia sp.]|nr:hypothetical protein [Puia sp.]
MERGIEKGNLKKGKTVRVLHIGVDQKTIDQLKTACTHSTCRTLGEYCRKVLEGGPVRITYRNLSQDDQLEEMIETKNRWGAAINGLENILGKLKSLPPYVKMEGLAEEIQKCVVLVMNATEETRQLMIQISKSWSQKSTPSGE